MQTTCPLEAGGTDLLTTEPREAVCTRAVGEKMKYFFIFIDFYLFCTGAIGEKMRYFFIFLFTFTFYYFLHEGNR